MQILGLRPATTADDPTLRCDWRSYRIKELTIHVPGKFIQPIDPQLVTHGVGQIFYLVEGASLVGMAASILAELTANNIKELARIPPSDSFPYRESSGKYSFNIFIIILD